jgi:cellulose synthase/poly-beta-1,6-N-acetylglucosamine synthase-like glycosyltransferase
MAYTKDRFVAVNGFKSHYSLSSGDDDLFIQEAANRKNVEVTLDPNSYMYSAAPESWEELLRQKARHYTTASHYKVIKRWVLGIYPLSLLIMTGTFVSLLFNSEFVWLSLAIYLFVLTIKWIIIGKVLAKLKENKFVAWFPFVDLFYAIWAPTLYYSIDKSDNKKW